MDPSLANLFTYHYIAQMYKSLVVPKTNFRKNHSKATKLIADKGSLGVCEVLLAGFGLDIRLPALSTLGTKMCLSESKMLFVQSYI